METDAADTEESPAAPLWPVSAILEWQRRRQLRALDRWIAQVQNPRPWGGNTSDNPGFFCGNGGGRDGGG